MASDKKSVAAKQADAPKEQGQDEQNEQPRALRVDMGESLPTPPIPTATDNE